MIYPTFIQKIKNKLKPFTPSIPTQAHYPGSMGLQWNQIPLGRGINGEIIWDINHVNNALLTGNSGSGRSTIQRSIIAHCLQHANNFELYMIDLKGSDLMPYAYFPDTYIRVELEGILGMLRELYGDMTDRYDNMNNTGINHFRSRSNPLPVMMIIINDANSLFRKSGLQTLEGNREDKIREEIFQLINSIARLGGAAGLRLVLTTETNNAECITGELKSNLMARIVTGALEAYSSRMALGHNGAVQLPDIDGRGYCQFNDVGEEFQSYDTDPQWIDKWWTKEIMPKERSVNFSKKRF